MNRLPLTVISGYLGAGKTTLINRLLAQPHGLRLMVMVNDFGAINIDSALIAAQDEDVIALTNGCVCCTMGADLFMAVGDALDRQPRPDHLIIEASGIADPKAIANTAIAEPDLRYAGIVTLVDALNIENLLADPRVGAQVRQQIAVADLVVQTKSDHVSAGIQHCFAEVGLKPPDLMDGDLVSLLMLDVPLPEAETAQGAHPAYTSWQHRSDRPVALDTLKAALHAVPEGLYRLKGFVLTDQGGFEVQLVGAQVDLRPCSSLSLTELVGLGPTGRVTQDKIAQWWSKV